MSIVRIGVCVALAWCVQLQVEAQKPELIVQWQEFARNGQFSPDGKILLSWSDKDWSGKSSPDIGCTLWEVATARALRTFDRCMGFSPDGILIAGSVGDDLKRWEMTTGQELSKFTLLRRTLPVYNAGELKGYDFLDPMAFSPDGKLLIQQKLRRYLDRDEYSIKLLEVSTGRELHSFAGHIQSNNFTSLEFSPDGKIIAIADYLHPGGPADITARGSITFWEAATGQKVGIINELDFNPDLLAFSPNGSLLASHGPSKGMEYESIKLWDMATGRELRTLTWTDVHHVNFLRAILFSPDGKKIATIPQSGKIKLWDVASGQELRTLNDILYSDIIALSPEWKVLTRLSRYDVPGQYQDEIKLWDIATGRELRSFPGENQSIWTNSAAFSSDGKRVAVKGRDWYRVWDLSTGKESQSISKLDNYGPVRLRPNGKELAIPDLKDNSPLVKLLNIATGQELHSFIDSYEAIYSADGGRLAVLGKANTIRLYEAATYRELYGITIHTTYNGRIGAIEFSHDGKLLATAINYAPDPGAGVAPSSSIKLLEVETGLELRTIEQGRLNVVRSLSFSPDGNILAVGYGDIPLPYNRQIKLWNTTTGQELHVLAGHQGIVNSVAFSNDGQILASGGTDGIVRIWNVATGKELRTLVGHKGSITSVAFSPDGKFILSGGEEGMKFWKKATGELLASLFTSKHGTWIVVAPSGQFDTNNLESLEEIQGVHWVMPDAPYHAVPLTIFMRDYYEPRLLPRLFAGEQLRPVRNVSNLNHVQPTLRISEIKPQANEHGTVNDVVTVTVEVANAANAYLRDGKQVTLESGAYDLRLFRDGQLVGYAPEQHGPIKLESGKATFTFKDIKLPRRADLKQVEFSAYAFNTDRVKSETARQTYVLPQQLSSVKGRAYIITVGVNAYENPALNLSFAASDARRMQQTLAAKLNQSGEYAEVITVPLISDYKTSLVGQATSPRRLKQKAVSRERQAITEKLATKGNVKAVLDVLAGRRVAPVLLAGIPGVQKLRPAQPEDAVIISFASHGYADNSGRFYFVTYDTGPGTSKDALLAKSISSDELSLWLRDVDVGELTLIVDACQSAATVEGEGFKPGPMGSRGLGQLAYDKGMRVLAAAQADNVALENKQIRQGLLTYALVHDGIELGRADFKPEDKTVTLGEWLTYATERVPQLFEEIKRGQVRGQQSTIDGETKVVVLPEKRTLRQKTATGEAQIQRPALFDFARKRQDIILLRK